MSAPTVVSLFAGVGGSSLGYKLAGYEERLAAEFDPHAVACLRANFPGVPVWDKDVRLLTGAEALRLARLEPGELDVLDGSPPCQGFSTTGRRDIGDGRNELFREFARLLRELRPRALVMENVTGMVKGKMKLVFAEIVRELRGAGYAVSARVLDAADFGVAQHRQRVIFIGTRADLGVAPSHPVGRSRHVPAREALLGVRQGWAPPLNDKYGRMWPRVPVGGRASDLPESAGKGFNGCVKIDPTRPAPTIIKTQNGGGFGTTVHWAVPRALTVEEAMRLTSFPDDYVIPEVEGASRTRSYQERWARVGNCVPPLMMRAIAEHVRGLVARPQNVAAS